jgi:hypothetical protein
MHLFFNFLKETLKSSLLLLLLMVTLLCLASCTDGEDGAPGPTGGTGSKGETGDKGAGGPDGETGEKGEVGDQGEKGNSVKGTIIGSVVFYDSLGSMLNDYSGIEIVVEGVAPEIKVKPNADGVFTIENIPYGTYNLLYGGSGIGLYKNYSVKVAGGSAPVILKTIRLFQTVKNPVTSFEVEAHVGGNLWITGLAKLSKGHCNNFYIYVSDSPDVSNVNYRFLANDGAFESENEMDFSIGPLDYYGFKKGSTVYVVIYGTAANGQSTYTDIDTGKTVFPGASTPSEIKSVKIPL